MSTDTLKTETPRERVGKVRPPEDVHMTGKIQLRAVTTAVVLLVVLSGLGAAAGHAVRPFLPAALTDLHSGTHAKASPEATPFTASLSVNPSQVQKGESISVQTNVNGGTSPYSYSYTGLPPGCGSQDSPQLSCNPSTSGNYNVQATVTDVNHNQTVSNSASLDVTSSNNGNGNGNGNNSSNPFSSLLSGLGGFLSIVVVFGIIGFVTWILLVVGIWIIAVVLLRRLPKRPSPAAAGSTMACAACGATLPTGSKFCSECGKSTAPKTP
jgi:hypothetical protein